MKLDKWAVTMLQITENMDTYVYVSTHMHHMYFTSKP